jgi:hypothetical protein
LKSLNKNEMSFEIIGKLIAKYDTVNRTESFRTREFVVEKSEEINNRTIVNYVKFQCVQDKTSMVDSVNIGDNVKVLFNIKGSKWEKEGKTNYITNLDAWKIEQLLKVSQNSQIDNEYMEPLDTFSATASDGDDLPF